MYKMLLLAYCGVCAIFSVGAEGARETGPDEIPLELIERYGREEAEQLIETIRATGAELELSPRLVTSVIGRSSGVDLPDDVAAAGELMIEMARLADVRQRRGELPNLAAARTVRNAPDRTPSSDSPALSQILRTTYGRGDVGDNRPGDPREPGDTRPDILAGPTDNDSSGDNDDDESDDDTGGGCGCDEDDD